jgi:tRNA pseudouridine38-40 synthase
MSPNISLSDDWNTITFEIATHLVQSVLDENELLANEETCDKTSFCRVDLRSTLRENILSAFPHSTRSVWSSMFRSRMTANATLAASARRYQSSSGKSKVRKRTFGLVLAYLGSSSCGWQRQPNDPRDSVQQLVEDALQQLLGHSVDLRASGRTDAGVHAIGQVARFRTSRIDLTASDIQLYLNQHPFFFMNGAKSIPRARTIRCLGMQDLTIDGSSKFHPSFGATQRSYVYLVEWKTPPREGVDRLVSDLNRLLQPLVGVKLDYYGLSHGTSHKQHYYCTLTQASAFPIPLAEDDAPAGSLPMLGGVGIALTSDRFLRRMARILVATALDGCRNVTVIPQAGVERSVREVSESSLLRIIRSRDRSQASRPAPASGLVFVGAEFD